MVRKIPIRSSFNFYRRFVHQYSTGYHLAMKKVYILSIKHDYLTISQYLVLHFKINIVQKWSRLSSPLNYKQLLMMERCEDGALLF